MKKQQQLCVTDLNMKRLFPPKTRYFAFWPSKLYSKNDKDRCVLCIEPTNSCDLTALTDYTKYRSCFI